MGLDLSPITQQERPDFVCVCSSDLGSDEPYSPCWLMCDLARWVDHNLAASYWTVAGDCDSYEPPVFGQLLIGISWNLSQGWV